SIWLTNRVGNRMTTDMRVRLFRQMQRLSTVYHDTKGTTDSTYRIQNDATDVDRKSTRLNSSHVSISYAVFCLKKKKKKNKTIQPTKHYKQKQTTTYLIK